MMRSASVPGFALAFVIVVAIAIGGVWATKGSAQPLPPYTPSAVVADEDRLNGQHVAVEGLLQNKGKNYFTDRRLVITDASGESKASLPVKEWLPIEAPPNPSGQTSSPPLLSDYLGKKVVLQGFLKEDDLRGFGTVKFLEVESARIVGEH
jgi:hypothetical protein